MRRRLIVIPAMLVMAAAACAQSPAYVRKEDVIYGRKPGLALTMDVFTSPTQNRAGIVYAVSGSWYSVHEAIDPNTYAEFLRRGYTVFAVVHGSMPKYTIPEILPDMLRAVRYIRFHAADFGIDPGRIGITGASAGGHLALLQGTAADDGDPKAKDPVDRVSSRVQAVACFCPLTDFLNYGQTGVDAIGRNALKDFAAQFDFHEYSSETKRFERIVDEQRIHEIARTISPVHRISATTPPTLIIHGDADSLVPIQQARSFVARMHEAGRTAALVVKPGAGHGWANILADMKAIADWFDRYLKPK